MDAFLDTLWEKIAAGAIFIGDGFDALLTPLHFLGPAVLIFLLALVTVAVAKGLNKVIVTKRYIELEKEFQYWFNLRQQALTCEDREKGKRMAKNIDQAKLNRVYYDYFFEGLLLGLARRVMPIFFMFAYINEYFRPARLTEIFGRSYIFKFSSADGEPVLMGTAFWYLASILLVYLLWFAVKKITACFLSEKQTEGEIAAGQTVQG